MNLEKKYLLAPIILNTTFEENQKVYLKSEGQQKDYGVLIEYSNEAIKELTLFFLDYNSELTYINSDYRQSLDELEENQQSNSDYNIFQNYSKDFKGIANLMD